MDFRGCVRCTLRQLLQVFYPQAFFLDKNKEVRELWKMGACPFSSALEFLCRPSVLTKSSSISARSSSSLDREKAAASKGGRTSSDFEIVRLEIRESANGADRGEEPPNAIDNKFDSPIRRYCDCSLRQFRQRNGRYYDKDNKWL